MKRKNRWPALARAVRAFVLVLLAGLVVTAYVERSRIRQERDRMGYIASAIGSETYEFMLSEMSKTRVLEAYLMETGGDYEDFGGIADILLREDYVRNVLFAPDGIVAAVFPLEGNEAVIGLNMYEDGAGNREAQAAIEKKELYIAGPFELIRGGVGIAGRLPVFLEDESGETCFWGIVSVTLDFPDALAGSSIERVNEQGFACQIWRINPDDGEKQVVLETDTPLPEGCVTVDYEQALFNSVWTVSMASLRPWYLRGDLWLNAAVSLLVALLAAAGFYYAERLRQMKAEESRKEIQQLQEQLEYEQGNMLLSQIRSHFFYHTLNSLQAIIILKPDAAYKMAGDFSRYLRFSLDSVTADGGVGSFREELRAVRAYADINQQQLGDRLRMVYDIPDVDFQIPLLTIQPIVENAILHGIKPKVGGGTVTLKLEELADC
ncbi:MAG: histidine kinase [Dysosmobacter sp.]|nr:histidine kinase [Dysosmobacter sp.]